MWEGLMLICFGVSWPPAIIKTLRVKNPAGKSFIFMTLVLTGYLSGIIGKAVSHLVCNDSKRVTCLAVYHQGIYVTSRLYGILHMQCGQTVQDVLCLGLGLLARSGALCALRLLVASTQHERE